MFKKFDGTSVSSVTNIKSSVQRGIRAKIIESCPAIEEYIDNIIPRKQSLKIAKCQDHIELLVNAEGEQLFFKQRDGSFLPSLRLLHKYPFLLPPMKVDKGAIRFVLSGANIMAPGLTSAGGDMSDVPAHTIVSIVAEGKQHPLAIGVTKLSTNDIRTQNKGIAIDSLHFLGDGLWTSESIN